MNAFAALVARDVALATRRGGEAALTLGFFVITIALFPFVVMVKINVLAGARVFDINNIRYIVDINLNI